MRKQELLAKFIELVPAFEAQWNSDRNCFRGHDGSYTYHGVCSEFSLFFEDHYTDLSDEVLEKLFELIEWNLATQNFDENDLDNALCTCFLENIWSTPCGQSAKPFMGPKARKSFDAGDQGPPY